MSQAWPRGSMRSGGSGDAGLSSGRGDVAAQDAPATERLEVDLPACGRPPRAPAWATEPSERSPGGRYGLRCGMSKRRSGRPGSNRQQSAWKANGAECNEPEPQALTGDSAPVCRAVCSADTETGRAELANGAPKHPAFSSPAGTGSVGTVAARAVGEPRGTLAVALAMIAELSLTPAEKAEAVRRLLDQDVKGKPRETGGKVTLWHAAPSGRLRRCRAAPANTM